MEIERKWLIDKNNIPYDLKNYESFNIKQSYISFHPTIRIRNINDDSYILTMKSSSKDNGLSREEYELEINEKEYNNLLSKKEGITLNKTRYRINEGPYIYEIDIFHGEYEGLAYMEIEFKDVEQAKNYVPPTWVLRELTYDSHFTNASLALGKIDITKI